MNFNLKSEPRNKEDKLIEEVDRKKHRSYNFSFRYSFPEPSPCESKKMDVCLIVDSSLSIKVPNFVRVKTFLTQFVHFFDATTHFSIITFAKYPVVRCRFSDKECQGPDGVQDLITTIPDKLYWGTFTDRALVEANQTVFIPENGDRPDASNVVIVITDGKPMKGSAPYNVTVPPLRVS